MKIHINNYLPIIDLGKNTEKTIFLSSSARSGSTFFANLLNHNKNYRILFEPLSKDHVRKARQLNFPSYLGEDVCDIKYKEFFNEIVSGQISNRWIDRENKPGFYSKRLIKEVRSNLLLPWIIDNFPQVKCILLLRNPLSVINSWNRLKFENGSELRDIVLEQNDFLKTIPEKILNKYKEENDPFLLSLYYWCFNNTFPLKNCDPNKFLMVKYEDLVTKRESTIQEIKNYTGIDIQKVSEIDYNKSSSSSNYKKSNQTVLSSKLNKSLSEELLLKAQNIMELFEITHLYNLNIKN